MIRAYTLPDSLDPNRYVLPVAVEVAHDWRIDGVDGARVEGDTVTLFLSDDTTLSLDVETWVRLVDARPVVSLLRNHNDYSTKYSSPFACYLDVEGDGTLWGDAVDGPGAFMWCGGRHYLSFSPTGFVDHVRSDVRPVNGVHAYNIGRDLFPHVAAWEDQQDVESEEDMYGHDWHDWRAGDVEGD